jgi:biotin-dependent carboxylase-like uncharacterized protein
VIEIVVPGLLTLLQDLGRPGWSSIGVGPSGAFDRGALRLANRLVGNAESAVGLEALAGGLSFRARSASVVAITGAQGAVVVHHAGRPGTVPRNSPVQLEADDIVTLGAPTHGLRSYVAVRHGIDTPRTLGSAASDTLAALGPAPLRAGDVLGTASDERGHPHVDHAAVRPRGGPLRVVLGPRDDWFDEASVALLLSTSWEVSTDCDRVGIRLSGGTLVRREPGRELASEPMVTGAIQVPPDGRPLVLGPDRPTTGGYPVIAVVIDADLDRLAQIGPGELLHFLDNSGT